MIARCRRFAWAGPIPLAALLVAAVGLAFAGVLRCGFVNFDDPVFVAANPYLADGLHPGVWRYAFLMSWHGNWNPLTALSHAAVIEWFGLDPFWHHLANLVLHAANALLAFGVMRAATRDNLASFFAALLFALHPLRVESVAWVAERKDVLAPFFILQVLLFHVAYVRAGRRLYYGLSLVALVGALLSKPTAVPVPVLLLIFDFWPLGRLTGRREIVRALLEKLPHFILCLLAGLLTIGITRAGFADALLAAPGWSPILGSFRVYPLYLAQTLFPVNLSPLYVSGPPTAGEIAGGIATVLGGSALAWSACRRAPQFAAGWLWFVASLFLVSGVVPLYLVFATDRWTYLPHCGLFACWVPLVFRRLGRGPAVALLAAAGVACGIATMRQVPLWRDSVTLFRRAYETAPSAVTARFLARAYLSQQQPRAALDLYRSHPGQEGGVAADPLVLAAAYSELGDWRAAAAACHEALRENPDQPGANTLLGEIALRSGLPELARHHLLIAARDDDSGRALMALGRLAMAGARWDDAAEYFRRAIAVKPDLVLEASNAIGEARLAAGDCAGAARAWREALAVQPSNPAARAGLTALGQTPGAGR